MKTVIVRGEKTGERTLIQAVALPWFEIIKHLKGDWTVAYQLSPEKWEEIMAGAYKKAGFDSVTLTPRSGDLGRDVIAIKKGLGEVRVIDQVKAYKPPHLVDANAVRVVMGVLQTGGAAKGFVTRPPILLPRFEQIPSLALSFRLDLN